MLIIHLIFSIIGDLLLLITIAISSAHLIKNHQLKTKNLNGVFARIPSINKLDQFGLAVLIMGIIFLAIGNIAGAFLAKERWGPHWYLDPREIWSLCPLLVLAIIFAGRIVFGFRGKRASLLTLTSAVFLLCGLLFLNRFFPSSKHKDFYIETDVNNG